MEIITTYLENVFKTLPSTPEVLNIKENLLGDMEAKYEDLRASGASEHEATARVIGEFGNIDELLAELGIDSPASSGEPLLPLISRQEINNFLSDHSKAAQQIAIGTVLILFGVVLLLCTLAMSKVPAPADIDWSLSNREIVAELAQNSGGDGQLLVVPLVLLFMCAIPGVGLLIYAGMSLDKFKRFERGEFDIMPDLKREIVRKHDAYHPSFTRAIITGVGIVLLAVMGFVITTLLEFTHPLYSVAGIILFVAIAIFILIRAGMKESAYKQLLKLGDYRPEAREVERVIGAVAAFVFPVAAVKFLVWGLVFDGWHIAWIVFPATAILFGGFAGLYSVLKGVD